MFAWEDFSFLNGHSPHPFIPPAVAMMQGLRRAVSSDHDLNLKAEHTSAAQPENQGVYQAGVDKGECPTLFVELRNFQTNTFTCYLEIWDILQLLGMWPDQSVSFEEIKPCSYGRLLADPHRCWPCFVFRKLWIATLILVCPHIYCNDDFLPHLTRSAREVWRLEVLLGSAIAAICPHCNPPVTPPPPSVLAHCKSCLPLQQLPMGKELWSNLFRL